MVTRTASHMRHGSARVTGNPEIAGATSVRGLIGGKEAIDHEVEVAPGRLAESQRALDFGLARC